jgi:ribonucleoside-diphosphate reductase alpha chain
MEIWKKVEISRSGEPGVYWTNDLEWGTNPCCEIALRAFQFCNLCEINASNVESQEDLNKRAKVAAFFGTLQAGFTDFHYLRPIWKKTTEAEALVGVGMTGICSGEILKYDLQEASQAAINENIRVASLIGINPAARATCVKPSGTTSCVLGTSSGVHGWFDHYYLRTVRFSKTEAIAQYLQKHHPELCEDDLLRKDTLCVRIPIAAPKGAIYRTETALETLARVKHFSLNWIKPGHVSGVNTHNVSCTVNLRDEEWEEVGNWMWDNQDIYNGIAVLPYDGGSYVQAVFESITEEEYNEKVKALKHIDLTQVIEADDNVNFSQESACAGGACDIQAA